MGIFKLTLLIFSLFAFSSCTEGDKVIPGEGASSVVSPFHYVPGFSNPPAPDDPGFPPIDRFTDPFYITIESKKSKELPFTHKGFLNGVAYDH